MYVKIPKERDSDLPYPRHIQDCKFRLWPEKNRPSPQRYFILVFKDGHQGRCVFDFTRGRASLSLPCTAVVVNRVFVLRTGIVTLYHGLFDHTME